MTERQVPITGHGIPEGMTVNMEPQFSDEHFIEEGMQHDQLREGPQAVDVRVSVDQPRHPGRFRRGAVKAAAIAIAPLAALGAYNAYEWVTSSPLEATHKADVFVGPARNTVTTDMFVNLADVTSQFPLSVHTSLDRFGPSNCDMRIDMKQGKQVQTTASVGAVFDRVEVTSGKKRGHFGIDVSGQMRLTPTAVNWLTTPIKFDRDLSMLDTCFNMDEPNSAMNIAFLTVVEAGQLGAACAIGTPQGESAIDSALIKKEKMDGAIPKNTPDGNIDVHYHGLADATDAVYARAVREFDQVTGKAIGDYLGETDSHKVHTNFTGIKDCSKHVTTLAPQK